MTARFLIAAASALAFASAVQAAPLVQDAPAQEAEAPAVRGERVTFRSRDEGQTELVGYLFRPTGEIPAAGAPAVVLMHGRAGAYSSLADGVYESRTLTQRHRYWAEYWADRGYFALIVDSFGPRGYPGGFAAGTYSSRPADINEVTIRPLDAYGALRYLRSLDGVDDDRIGLMGWSNGGSAALATMADDKPGDMRRIGFRAAIAMYPGCGLQNRFRQGYTAYAPVEIFMGTADEEVSHDRCQTFAAAAHGSVVFHSFVGASHTFDDPGRRRQSVPANAEATRAVRERAAQFFDEALAPR